jgi:hypothetical protein
MTMSEHNKTGLVEPALIPPGRGTGIESNTKISGKVKEQLSITSRTNYHNPEKNSGAPP